MKTPKPLEYETVFKTFLYLQYRHNYKNFGVKISYQLFFKKKLETHESPKISKQMYGG